MKYVIAALGYTEPPQAESLSLVQLQCEFCLLLINDLISLCRSLIKMNFNMVCLIGR